jgi:hypothetical protein
MARTPGFIQDGVYDDLAAQDDYEQALPPPQQSGGLSAMLAAAPDAPLPPPRREYDGGPSVDPGPQVRQRITLDAAPLPPKPSLMRQIIGTAAGAYLPQVGAEILAPGYSRKMREYNNNRQRMMDEGKLNVQAADEQHKIAAARAQMANAEAAAARKQAELSRAGSYGRPVVHQKAGERILNNNDGSVLAAEFTLPEKPPAPGLRITKAAAEALGIKVPDGQDYYDVPNQGTSAFLTTRPRADRGYDTMKQAVHDEHPDWEQADVDAEAAKRYREAKDAEKKRTEAQATRALRTPAGRSGTAGTATANAEARRSIDEMAKAQIAEAGDVDKAIANMAAWPSRDETAEKVLLHLKALKGGKAMGGGKGKVDVNAIAARFGVGAPTAPKAATPTAKPADKNKDPLGVR